MLAEARRIADQGYTEIQLLGQNVNSYRDPEGKLSFAELLAAVGQVPGIRRVRFTTSHPRDFTRDIVEAIDAYPTLCDHVHLPVQSGSSRVLKDDGAGIHARLVPGAHQLDQGGEAQDLAFHRHHRRISGRDADDFIETMDLLQEVQYDCVFGFKYSGRPNTPALTMIDSIPDAEKAKRLQVVLDRQREIQRVNYAKHLGEEMEVMVEGTNPARGQVAGRSTQNKPVNFTTSLPIAPAPGSYVKVRITDTFPNSLVGEAV